MHPEIFIFITLFLCVTGILVTWLYHKTKRENDRQNTIRKAIEQGQALDKEILENLSPSSKPGEFRDLRIGLPFIGIGIAFMLVGFFGAKEDSVAWAGAFPIMFGLSWVIIWFLARKK